MTEVKSLLTISKQAHKERIMEQELVGKSQVPPPRKVVQLSHFDGKCIAVNETSVFSIMILNRKYLHILPL